MEVRGRSDRAEKTLTHSCRLCHDVMMCDGWLRCSQRSRTPERAEVHTQCFCRDVNTSDFNTSDQIVAL